MARRYEQPKHKRPLIVICSEGSKKSSEYYYFRNFSNRDLRIQFSTGNSTDPKGMLDDLIKYIHNEDIKSEDNVKIFLVLDTDLNEKRISEIKEIEEKCNEYNIEIITSAPTFEIWYLMHYRDNRLKFNTSKEVKRKLEIINGKYSETMDMYRITNNKIEEARKIAETLEKGIIDNKEDLLISNPHTSVYKILDAIDEFNNLKQITF